MICIVPKTVRQGQPRLLTGECKNALLDQRVQWVVIVPTHAAEPNPPLCLRNVTGETYPAASPTGSSQGSGCPKPPADGQPLRTIHHRLAKPTAGHRAASHRFTAAAAAVIVLICNPTSRSLATKGTADATMRA